MDEPEHEDPDVLEHDEVPADPEDADAAEDESVAPKP